MLKFNIFIKVSIKMKNKGGSKYTFSLAEKKRNTFLKNGELDFDNMVK